LRKAISDSNLSEKDKQKALKYLDHVNRLFKEAVKKDEDLKPV